MTRKIFAVIAGVITAILCFVSVETLNHQIHPFPASLNFNNAKQVNEYMQTVPLSFWLLVLAGWAVGSVLAGFVIQKISKTDSVFLPSIAGIVLTLSSIANLFAFQHPIWFMVLALILFVPAVFLGNVLAKGK
jgi:hypothetical protein